MRWNLFAQVCLVLACSLDLHFLTKGHAQAPVPPNGRIPIFVSPYYDSNGEKGPHISAGPFSGKLSAATAETILALTKTMHEPEAWDKLSTEAMFVTAIRLYDWGFKDEASFWYYSADYRIRLIRAIVPPQDFGGIGDAVFESLTARDAFRSVAGEFLLKHAMGDLPKLRTILKQVIGANESLPKFKEIFPNQKFSVDINWLEKNKQVAADFQSLIEFTETNADEIEANRQGDGANAKKFRADKLNKQLEQGVKLDLQGKRGQVALFAAMDAEDRKLFTTLLKLGADPNAKSRQGESTMHQATQQLESFWIQEALAHGGDPNRTNDIDSTNQHCSPLNLALVNIWHSVDNSDGNGRFEIVMKLISAGADVSHVNSEKHVPCISAAQLGDFRIVVELLKARANPLSRDLLDETLVDWFEQHDEHVYDQGSSKLNQIPYYRQARQILIDRGLLQDKPIVSKIASAAERLHLGSDWVDPDPKGETTVFRAIEAKNKVAYLRHLNAGVDPNICDPDDHPGISAMHLAAEKDDVFWMRQALAHGGNANHTTPVKTEPKSTAGVNRYSLFGGFPYCCDTPPIFLAARRWQNSNVVELLDAGARVDHLDRAGKQTACGEAAEHGNYELVVILLYSGADARLAKKHGEPLIKWFEEHDEQYVFRESQLPWYHEACRFLIQQGFLKQKTMGKAAQGQAPRNSELAE
ncbi:MAG: ankyrin-like [Planctomycetaceae bacterium]|nr:ankyrin-like [Planctomycetaceae bacterium]